jgi:glycosyltransferase involved in cell wall biosynthesis
VSASPAPVAVIIPAFNAGRYLDETLASVAAQSVLPAEVVVGDDASTDDTVAVAERWADRLPLAVVRSSVNGGPSAARRLAIGTSRSPLVALLDADDVWLPDHLSTLVALHRARGGLVMADGIRWLPGEGTGTRWSDVYDVPALDVQLAALYRENWVISCTLFERELYDRVGGFRGSVRVGEDWDLWIRMVRGGAVVSRADHPTVLYRMSAGSLMSTDRGIDDRIAVLELAADEVGGGADEVAAVRAGLRHLRAERHLISAYRLAGEGRSWPARMNGLAAVKGRRRVAMRGLAMVIAPRRVAARRNSIRGSPRGRLET